MCLDRGAGNPLGHLCIFSWTPPLHLFHAPTHRVPVEKLDQVNEELKRLSEEGGLLGLLPNPQIGCLICWLKKTQTVNFVSVLTQARP